MRDELGPAFRVQASQEISARILRWDGFPAAGVVFAYLPMRGEVDLRPLMAVAPPKVRWAIPRVAEGPDRHLVFHDYNPERLIQHRFGMLEPDPTLPEIALDPANLILVPGLAFTLRGHRLGYGGGYYDRLLSATGHAPTLGVCYQALLVDEIPHAAHDLPVDYLVTEERGVLACRGTD